MKLTLREWQRMGKADIIIQAVHPDGSDRCVPFPIGMHHSYIANYHGAHELLILMAHNLTNDAKRRPNPPNRRSMTEALIARGIVYHRLSPESYFATLPHYKFVISPEGRGIDCHRTYEALMAGCIPIVEDSPHIRKVYEGCPILYTTDYSELTVGRLELKYNEMLDTVWDFSRLFMSYYDMETQATIKMYTNLGLKFLAGWKKDMYNISKKDTERIMKEIGEPWRYINGESDYDRIMNLLSPEQIEIAREIIRKQELCKV